MRTGINLRGMFHFKLFDAPKADWKKRANLIAAKSGQPIPFMGQLNRAWNAKNGATTSGLNLMLDDLFNSGTQYATWTIGLIDNASFSSLATSDTMSSHAGWLENSDYSQSNRPTWGSGSASGGSVTNGTNAQFTITADCVINGAFLVSGSNAPDDTTNTLFCTCSFANTATLSSGQTLNVTYTVTATPA